MKKRRITDSMLYESQISYDAFTKGGQLLMSRVAENLKKAKDELEMVIYGEQSNSEAEPVLREMHSGICAMLDDLPW